MTILSVLFFLLSAKVDSFEIQKARAVHETIVYLDSIEHYYDSLLAVIRKENAAWQKREGKK
jgi:hypothetical protein